MNIKKSKITKYTDSEMLNIIRELHKMNSHLDDRIIDFILDLKPDSIENYLNFYQIHRLFNSEQYIYEGTPYNNVRDFLKAVNPESNQTIYDFGSGYGRVVIYGAINYKAIFIGIELILERVLEAERIAERFNLDNAHFVQANILNWDFSNGDIFFLFNPFSFDTLSLISARLNMIAREKEIKIVCWGSETIKNIFMGKENLEQFFPLKEANRLSFFKSRA